jgi:hypothetical protein
MFISIIHILMVMPKCEKIIQICEILKLVGIESYERQLIKDLKRIYLLKSLYEKFKIMN